jgi:hypothetical protein
LRHVDVHPIGYICEKPLRDNAVAKCSILSWQEIPSMVEARDASGTKKIQLSQRFQELIDLVAMRRGLAGTDQYLEEWRRGRPVEREGDAASVAKAIADEVEARFDEIRAKALAGPDAK